MRFPVRSSVLASFAVPLLAALVATDSLAAQLTTLASYPLLTDLLDKTSANGPVMLTGSPPPSPPANGVCVNGIYFYNAGGQDVRTPILSNLNTSDFQVDVEFMVAALPGNRAPVFMGGHLWRFLGIYVQANGIIGLKHNNSNLAWSNTTVTTGKWYIASMRFENGTAELVLDGQMVMSVATGPLSTSTNLNFTTNDFSTGLNHNGCIRNVVIYNDTTLGTAASAQDYGYGCGGLTMSANGVPKLGNAAFALNLSNVPASSVLGYMAMGRTPVNPGLDLAVIGMTGCASFTRLDLGVFGPSVVMSGVATFPLPIPNDPTLTSLVLYAQGLAMSPATTLGLATSNATQLVLGL